MKRSDYQKDKVEELKQKAINLYKQGLTTREVGGLLGRSHTWIAEIIKENYVIEKDNTGA